MVKLGLKPLKRNKRKYSSYKGTVGKVADNIINRDFEADKPNEKWYTDVTEFNLRGEKVYLSPILDGFNQEVISYNTSKSPNLEQINDMLNKAFDRNNNLDGLIFHSDQGWQYQHESYQQRLKNKGIKQSMSRKGNSMDNGLMENFFGILKTEMFYDQEDKYETLDDFIEDAKSRKGESIIALSNTFGTGPTYCTLLNEQTGMDAELICYDSGSRCVTEVLGDHAEVSCSNYTDFVDQIAAGEMTCLAVCLEERSELLPDVPTVNECGYDIFSLGYLNQMSFMMAPAGLDPEIKEKLSSMFKEACQTDEYQEFATGRSFISSGTTGEELDSTIQETYSGLKEAYDTYFAT